MSVSGEPFGTEEFFSPARFNRKVPSHLTGAQIAGLSPTYPNQLVVCTSTGSGFTVDTMYRRNTANTSWIGGGGDMHKHDANTDAAGGLLSDILYANLAKVLWFPEGAAPSIGEFNSENSSVTPSYVHPSIVLSCGTLNGAYAHLSRSGAGVSWASPVRFLARLYVNIGSNMSVRFGVCAEHVNDATAGTGAKMGFEACDSAGSAQNYVVFSSNGTTRSGTTTTTAVGQGQLHAWRLDYTVATDVKAYMDNGLLTTKTTNVPTGGGTIDTRVIGAGIRQNASVTAGNERIMRLNGLTMTGVPSTTAWI